MTSRARIAFVISRLGLGGAERQLVGLVNNLNTARFTPTVVCLKDAGPLAADLVSGTNLVALGIGNGSDPRVVGHLSDILRDCEADLVHCTNFNATLWGRAAARRRSVPSITAEHSTHRTSVRERVLVRVGNAIYDRDTDCVVACAKAQVPVLVTEGCSERNIRVIHNGVDIGGFGDDLQRRIARDELSVSEDDVVVLVVANLSFQKNHSMLLRAAAKAIHGGLPLRVVLVGEGPTRAPLETLVADLGMQAHVSLLGVRSDVSRLIAGSDVVALTSLPLVETFPLCLLEAMAGRRSVVATSVGGIPEMVVDGATGLLVDSGDVDGLVAALARLASDASLRSRMGTAGRARVETQFSTRAMCEAYEAVFERALAGKGVAD